jgi:hypothetical protein
MRKSNAEIKQKNKATQKKGGLAVNAPEKGFILSFP